MTARKIYTFRLNDTTPEDHLGRLGEITYRDGFLYYHDGATAGGELIGGSSGGSGGPTSWASVTGKPSFATVATSGSYADLTGKPTLFSGSYNDLTDTPTLTTGPQGAAGATGEPGAQGPQGERAEEDRLVNGAQEVVLDSDGTLTILDSNNVPKTNINFKDAFPVAIEALDFDITSSSVEYFVGIASFKYKLFDIEVL